MSGTLARLRWAGVVLAWILLFTVAHAQNTLEHPDQPTFVVAGISPQQDLRILVYGDMRFTDPVNTKDTNPRARKWLAEKVGTEHGDAMVITGNIPFHGSDPRGLGGF